MTAPRRDLRGLVRCPWGCGQIVRRTVNSNGKRIYVDPDPHPDGNQAAWLDAQQTWRSRQLRKNEQPAGYERRFMPHIATCPATQQTQLPIPLPAGVIDLAARRERRRRR